MALRRVATITVGLAALLLSIDARADTRIVKVLGPGSAAPIQQLFESMRPGVTFEYVRINRDNVDARLCLAGTTTCARVSLSAPGPSCRTVGAFCLSYPDGAPDTRIDEALSRAVQTGANNSIWSDQLEETRPPPITPRTPLKRPALLVAFLLLGVALLRWGRTDRAGTLAALGVFALSLGWMLVTSTPPGPVGVFASVLDCLDQNICVTAGVTSSIFFFNGSIFQVFLVAIALLDGSPTAVWVATLTWLALGVTIVFLFVWRFARREAALPTAVLCLALIVMSNVFSPLLDVSLTFTFAAAATIGLEFYTRFRDRWTLAATAILLAHALCTHVSVASLIPGFFFVLILASPQPWPLSVGGAIALCAVVSFITSAEALASNMHNLEIRKALLVALALTQGALFGIALLLRSAYARWSSQGRSLVFALAVVVPFVGGTVVLRAIAHPVRPEYFPVVIAPAAVVMMRLACGRASRWRPWLALAACVALLAMAKPIWVEGFYGPGTPPPNTRQPQTSGRRVLPRAPIVLAQVAPVAVPTVDKYLMPPLGKRGFVVLAVFIGLTTLAAQWHLNKQRPASESERL